MTTVDDALAFAEMAHEGQTRRGSDEPYFTHVRRVVDRLRDWGVTDEDVLAAAALHDVVEDTKWEYVDILDDFGPRIMSLVYYLTKDIQASKHGVSKEAATKAMLAKLRDAPPSALLIKCADRVDNLLDSPRDLPRYIGESHAIWLIAQAKLGECPATREFRKTIAKLMVKA